MLYLTKHPDGPELPQDARGRRFRSYVALATWADQIGLQDGHYWCRNDRATSLATRIREVRRTGSGFWVEGRGHI